MLATASSSSARKSSGKRPRRKLGTPASLSNRLRSRRPRPARASTSPPRRSTRNGPAGTSPSNASRPLPEEAMDERDAPRRTVRRCTPVRRQPPDPPRAATQLAALQAPDRVGIVAGIAQRLPAGPVVAVRQPRQLSQPGPQQVALARSAEAAQRLQGDPGQIQPVRPIQFRGLAAGPEVDGGQFSQQVRPRADAPRSAPCRRRPAASGRRDAA